MDDSDLKDSLRELLLILGEHVVGLIAGVEWIPLLHEWASGSAEPSEDVIRALVVARRVVDLLSDHETPQTMRTWMIGENPVLGEAPALAIRADKDGDAVIGAAKAHLAGAYE